MAPWAIALAIAALMGVYAALMHFRSRRRTEEELIRRIRRSLMYEQLTPLWEQCRELMIESVIIRPEEIRIQLFRSSGRMIRFVFEEHDLDPVDQPEALRALAMAVSQDVKVLGDRSKYFFTIHTAPRDFGDPFRWYQYNVQVDYKDRMQRALYDDGGPQEGVYR